MLDKIVVTGATGFAGSHILDSFGDDENVIASCRDRKKLPSIYQVFAIVGDLQDLDYIEKLTQKADIICHAASWAEMNGKVSDSKEKFLNPTIELIDKAVSNGVKRFIFLSSISSKPIEENRLHSKLKLSDIWAHYDSIMKIESYLKGIDSDMEVIILRVGFFTGKNYALGLLPILLPRLKTHLVPWIQNGHTSLPLIDGKDVGLAFKLASKVVLKERFTIIDIVGKDIPTAKEVFTYLHDRYHYPLPHFSVSFSFAYIFARLMRIVHKVIPTDPLIVPAIVLLLEETHANNNLAKNLLGYEPKIDWKDSIDTQIAEMKIRQTTNLRMNK